jgi:uncharacterized protein (DUF488 family)
MKSGGEKPLKVIYTLGTSTRSMEDFLDILRAKGISMVCDVRSFPGSRRYPHFSSEAFAASLEKEGISYRWLGSKLGGHRKGGYTVFMETPDFAAGLRELEDYASRTPTTMVCAELLPWKCHRRFIAGALEERGWVIVHILDAARDWKPALVEQRLPLE